MLLNRLFENLIKDNNELRSDIIQYFINITVLLICILISTQKVSEHSLKSADFVTVKVMADNVGNKCLKEIVNCGSYQLPDLDLPPWSPPSSFHLKHKEEIPPSPELRNKILQCLNRPRRKFKRPPLTPLFTPKLSPAEIGSYFSMGDNTLRVPMALFAENRRRLCEKLRENKHLPKGAIVLLQGGDALNLYSTDVEYVFRQEPYFHWTFGAREPGCYGAIIVETGESILFVPRLSESYATWSGSLKSLCEFKKIYETDQVNYVDQIKFVMRRLNDKFEFITLLTLLGLNTDSGLMTKEAVFDGLDEFKVENTLLFPAITELRVFKTPLEIEVLKYTNTISSEAHKQVMRRIKHGMKEYQCESIFLDYCYFVGGARHVSYTCICGSGENGAILHYGHAGAPNDKTVRDGEICCFDMGCSYCGYASDITCSFPVSGKFTEDQKLIYNAVLAARNTVFEKAKPGVSWCNMHLEANKTMLEHMRDGGLLQGEIDEMISSGIAAIFQPHGLGHLMGCDVHDVGGYLEGTPERPSAPGFNKLRTARTLLPGMVLTVEPGCYFIPCLLDRALDNPKQSKFLVRDVIERFRNFGGIRIEDDVLITEDGLENLTKVPRTVEEIEEWMAGTDYLKAVDNLMKVNANNCLAINGTIQKF